MRPAALAIAAAVAVTTAPVAARQASRGAAAAEITVDVTVLDANRRPVPALAAADFKVTLAGQAVPVRALAWLTADTSASRPAQTPGAPNASNELPADARRTFTNQAADAFDAAPIAGTDAGVTASIEPRVFVLAFDDLSLSPAQGQAAISAMSRFLDLVPAADAVGFTTTSSALVVNPTSDRAAVRAVLRQARGLMATPADARLGVAESLAIARDDEPAARRVAARECFAGDDSQVRVMPLADLVGSTKPCLAGMFGAAKRLAEDAQRTRQRQVAALAAVADALRNAPGIRHLVVVTGGIAAADEDDALAPFAAAASASNVDVSVIVAGPETEGGAPDAAPRARQNDDAALRLDGADALADIAGAQLYQYREADGVDPIVARVIATSGAVYRLRLDAPRGASTSNAWPLAVSVARPGVTVMANRVAILAASPAPPEPASASDATVRLKAALSANLTLRDLALRAGASIRRSGYAAGQIDVSVNVELPASFTGSGPGLIGIVDASNAMRVTTTTVTASSSPAQFVFPVAPGRYRVRVGVADARGTAGTIEVPVVAELHPFGEFTASDVLTWTVDAAGAARMFSIDTVPGADVLNASLEIYPREKMPSEPPIVRWTITPQGSDAAIMEEDAPGRVGPSLFRSDVEIPMARLTAGAYIVRAALVSPDGETVDAAASVAARVRKLR